MRARTVHVLLFVLAGALFYVGLALGLQYSSTWGTVLWGAALAVLLVNVLWMARRRR